jgi:integrase
MGTRFAIDLEAAPRTPFVEYVAQLGESSRKPQIWACFRAAQMLDGRVRKPADLIRWRWHKLRRSDAESLRVLAWRQYAPTTARRIFGALVAVMRAAAGLDPRAIEGVASVKAPRSMPVEKGRVLTDGELAALLQCPLPGRLGPRDKAAIALLYGCGLRRSELAGAQLADLSLPASSLWVRDPGHRPRRVPIPDGTRKAIETWLGDRGWLPGPLVTAGTFDHFPGQGAMTATLPRDILARASMRAGLTKRVRPSDLRRTYVAHLLAAGFSPAFVGELTTGELDPATIDRDAAHLRAASAITVRS